ncbi:MAG: hypothetical protein AB1898_20820 [Acidobacteriota bacterium]
MSKKHKERSKTQFHPRTESKQPETVFGAQLREALERSKPSLSDTSGSHPKQALKTPSPTKGANKPGSSTTKASTTLKSMISTISSGTQRDGDEDQQLWSEAVKGCRSLDRRQEYLQKISKALSEREKPVQERTIPVILGIDMGTSITKVVWREEEAQISKPICFGSRRHLIDDYLLPSVVAFDGNSFAAGLDVNQFLSLRPKAGTYSHFKMCLACVSADKSDCDLHRCPLSHWRPVLAEVGESEAVKAITALHLGKVISASRRFVVNDFRRRGINGSLRWIVNLGAPVEHMDDKSVLGSFEGILKVAWLMADIFDESMGPRELGDLLDCYESAGILAEKRPLDCHVYPEVGAEVACLYLSRSVRDGLYAFVDVG